MSLYRTVRQAAKRTRRRAFELAGSDRYSRPSQFALEDKLDSFLSSGNGTFIEAGANDGFVQSNTYWLERFRNWRGILVEPDPSKAAECRLNRPNAMVVNAALVDDPTKASITISTANLMAYVTGSFADPENERKHRIIAMECQNLRDVREIEVPARTLESIIDESGFERIDLLSLDVEGYELHVLRGMNIRRYRPRFMMIEGRNPDVIMATLQGHYVFRERITEQDLLFSALD